MKRILIFFVLTILSSCDLDVKVDNSNEIDSDDINVIDKAWKQSFDKAIELYDTKTSAS